MDDIDFSFAVPAENRKDPLFWICEIRFLQKFSADPEQEIRRIQFRKGLNIVWAQAPKNSSPDDKQRISGHAAGKTTLCRMIRYLLGEPHFASKSVASAIRQKFPNGYVAGRFMINGESWCVARSFMNINDDYSQKNDSLDLFLGEEQNCSPFLLFEEKLEALLPMITPLSALANGEKLSFLHILPWLTRDQDNQYSKLTGWRDNSLSDSGNPALRQKQAMLIMRSILDSQVSKEAELIFQQAELVQKLQECRNRLKTAEAVIDSDALRIRELDNQQVPTELDDLYLDMTRKHNEKLLETFCVDEKDENTLCKLQGQRDNFFSQYQFQLDQYNGARQSYNQHVREFNEQQKNTDSAIFEEEHHDEIQAAAQIHPSRKFCCTPLDLALEEGCPLASKFTTRRDYASHANLVNSKQPDMEKKKKWLQDFKTFLSREKTLLLQLEHQWKDAEKELSDFKIEVNKKRNARAARIGNLLEAVHRYEDDLQEKRDLAAECESLASQQKDCSDKLAALRDAEKISSHQIQKIYFDTIRFILGSDIYGRLSFSGGEIELDCDYNRSSLSSAALNSVKNICFDLAAMAASISGKGEHPRFLIHDGPRVADLAPSIFSFYFSYARKLEISAPKEVNFQYIITTTEPPPSELQISPWLICKLDSTIPEMRLLKCNL